MADDPLSSLDLNFLVVFDAVMAESSVKRAAEHLRMNPPAVSQALGRLRDAVGVDLFIRSGHGLRPTPRATQMWESVRMALSLINTSLTNGLRFDPTKETRTFLLDLPAGTDSLITPKLAELTTDAPGLRFLIANSRALNVLNDLRYGESVLAFDYRAISQQGYHCELLTEQQLVLVATKDHPDLQNGLTVDLYCSLPQIAVAAARSTTILPVNERLEALGKSRFVKFVVPGLLSALSILARGDGVATMPLCTAEMCTKWSPLAIHPIPLDLPKVPFYMVWHSRFDSDAGHSWLRDKIREIAAPL